VVADAGSSEALADAARALLNDSARRAALAAAGRSRARARSWDATARVVAEVYRSLGVTVRARCA
jgi:glycosyltransferase involved in cell wall biosynthesis